MTIPFPDPAMLQAALLARDPAHAGRAFVSVSAKGMFCLPSCPAPKPQRRNGGFHDTAAARVARGFRPCKRCHPLGTAAPALPDLLSALPPATAADDESLDLGRLRT